MAGDQSLTLKGLMKHQAQFEHKDIMVSDVLIISACIYVHTSLPVFLKSIMFVKAHKQMHDSDPPIKWYRDPSQSNPHWALMLTMQ